MFENNNKEIIKKLSKKVSLNNKGRNFILRIAIILLTTLLTIGLTTWFSSFKTIDKIKESDKNYYGYSPWELNFNKVEVNNIIERIIYSKYVHLNEEVVENISFKENNLLIKEIKDQNYYKSNNIILESGSFPENRNEVLMPSWVNNKFNNTLLKKEITVRTLINTYSEFPDHNGSTISTKYKVSGIYKADEDILGDIFIVSKEITFDSLYIITFVIFLIILSGYLLIYNILYVNVINEFKIYGLLRVLGMRKEDIKKVILNQVLKLSISAIPIGLLIGYKIGNIITPMIISFVSNREIIDVSNNISIFILSILLSFITIYISVIKPSEIASKINLTETIKSYSLVENSINKRTIRRAHRCKLSKIAFINLFRNKKKMFLTFASLGLSSIVLVVSINGYLHLNPIVIVTGKEFLSSDIRISHTGLYERNTRFKMIDTNFINELKNKDYIERINISYEAILPINGRYISYGGLLSNEGKIKSEFSRYLYHARRIFHNYKNPWIPYNESLPVSVNIQGKNSYSLKTSLNQYNIINGTIDYDKFSKEDYIIAVDTDSFTEGEIVDLGFLTETENGDYDIIKKQYKVMAVVSNKSTNLSDLEKTFIINESNFKGIYGDDPIYNSEILIDLKDDFNYNNATKDICKLASSYDNNQIKIESKYLINENLKELQSFFLRIGIIISIIVGLIGLINLINSVLTGLFNRTHEFSIYLAIGMTKKQLKKLILIEGLYGCIMSSMIVIISGFLSLSIIESLVPFSIIPIKLFSIISVIMVIIITCIINILIPILGYKYIIKMNLIKDLKSETWI